MIKLTKNVWKINDESYAPKVKIIRFIISGGTSTLVNLSILFILTHFLNVWYLISSVVSFLLSFFVSFALQKFWTFRDHSKEVIHKQAFIYLLIVVADLYINTSLLYAFVEFVGTHYLIAQLMSGIMIAFINFYLYQKFIFNKK